MPRAFPRSDTGFHLFRQKMCHTSLSSLPGVKPACVLQCRCNHIAVGLLQAGSILRGDAVTELPDGFGCKRKLFLHLLCKGQCVGFALRLQNLPDHIFAQHGILSVLLCNLSPDIEIRELRFFGQRAHMRRIIQKDIIGSCHQRIVLLHALFLGCKEGIQLCLHLRRNFAVKFVKFTRGRSGRMCQGDILMLLCIPCLCLAVIIFFQFGIVDGGFRQIQLLPPLGVHICDEFLLGHGCALFFQLRIQFLLGFNRSRCFLLHGSLLLNRNLCRGLCQICAAAGQQQNQRSGCNGFQLHRTSLLSALIIAYIVQAVNGHFV